MASGSGVEKNALNASANAGNQAQASYNTVNPIYTSMATTPTGFTPTQKANQLTASADSLGGSVSAATGAGGLYAARTGNAGGATAAMDDAARNAEVVQSGNAVDIENKDAALATQNQRIGLAGLNGIYDDANKTGSDYLNIADSAAQARAKAKMGYIKMGLQTAGTLAGGA